MPDDKLDQELIDRTARQLESLDDHAFEVALDKNIAQPIPEMVMAFRRPFLAPRSYAAAGAIISRLNNSIHGLDLRKQEDRDRRSRLAHQQTLVGRERTLLKHIVDTERLLAGGVLPTAPNPRARAARELQKRYPVEFLEILREIQAADKAKAKAESKRRRAERVAFRSASTDGRQSRR